MKMNFRSLVAVAALVAASPFFAGTARADSSLNFSVWTDGTKFVNASTPFAIPTPTDPADITGTITDPSSSINFYSSTDNNLSGFLQTGSTGTLNTGFTPFSNGNTVNYTMGGNQVYGNGTSDKVPSGTTGGINNDVMEFTGTTYLQNNMTYTVTHDDGMYLSIDGSWIFSPNTSTGDPTGAAPSSFTWTGASGPNTFALWYSEVNGAPAVLQSNLALAPEPSSLLLLGTGLLGMAFLLFRRKAVKPVSHVTLSV